MYRPMRGADRKAGSHRDHVPDGRVLLLLDGLLRAVGVGEVVD